MADWMRRCLSRAVLALRGESQLVKPKIRRFESSLGRLRSGCRGRLQRMVSSPKRLHADELDFGELPRPERANSIMHLWRFRGAYRPITAFYKFECKLGEAWQQLAQLARASAGCFWLRLQVAHQERGPGGGGEAAPSPIT